MDSAGAAKDWGAPTSIRARLRTRLEARGAVLAEERDRWALWIPVALGVGVGLYSPCRPSPPAGPGRPQRSP
jgi:competence protein ComEC